MCTESRCVPHADFLFFIQIAGRLNLLRINGLFSIRAWNWFCLLERPHATESNDRFTRGNVNLYNMKNEKGWNFYKATLNWLNTLLSFLHCSTHKDSEPNSVFWITFLCYQLLPSADKSKKPQFNSPIFLHRLLFK